MSARQPATPPALKGFRYLKPLGHGGFSDVFLYEEERLGRQVGVKVLTSRPSAEGQKAFEDEANRMAQLSSHPFIVSIHQAGVSDDGRAYLVMEYCPHPHLLVKIRQKPLSVVKALEVGVQIAGAVETAHRLGIIHRDIKPANILFTQYGWPALTDFGIATTTQGAETGDARGMSVPWAPPEQLLTGSRAGRESDVYSLAATIWTALTGHSPFEYPGASNSKYELAQRIRTTPVPRTGRDDVPESFERALRAAMDKSPSNRYPTALEFARALQAVQTELHITATPINVLEVGRPDEEIEEEGTGTVFSQFSVVDVDGPGTRTGNSPDRFTQPREMSGISGPGTQSLADSTITGGAGAVLQHGRGFSTDTGSRDLTSMPLPQVEPGEASSPVLPVGSAPARNRRRGPGLVAGVIAGALLVAGGVFVGHWYISRDATASVDQSPATASASAADPVGAVVPVPTGVKAVRSGGRVAVSWRNPDPQSGDTFAYRVVDQNGEGQNLVTAKTSATVSAPAGRKTCVQVLMRRSSGQYSEWSESSCAR